MKTLKMNTRLYSRQNKDFLFLFGAENAPFYCANKLFEKMCSREMPRKRCWCIWWTLPPKCSPLFALQLVLLLFAFFLNLFSPRVVFYPLEAKSLFFKNKNKERFMVLAQGIPMACLVWWSSILNDELYHFFVAVIPIFCIDTFNHDVVMLILLMGEWRMLCAGRAERR